MVSFIEALWQTNTVYPMDTTTMQQMKPNGTFKTVNLQQISSSGYNYIPFILTFEHELSGVFLAAKL